MSGIGWSSASIDQADVVTVAQAPDSHLEAIADTYQRWTGQHRPPRPGRLPLRTTGRLSRLTPAAACDYRSLAFDASHDFTCFSSLLVDLRVRNYFWSLAAQHRQDALAHVLKDPLAGQCGQSERMWCYQHPGVGEDRVSKVRWFGVEHVQGGACESSRIESRLICQLPTVPTAHGLPRWSATTRAILSMIRRPPTIRGAIPVLPAIPVPVGPVPMSPRKILPEHRCQRDRPQQATT